MKKWKRSWKESFISWRLEGKPPNFPSTVCTRGRMVWNTGVRIRTDTSGNTMCHHHTARTRHERQQQTSASAQSLLCGPSSLYLARPPSNSESFCFSTSCTSIKRWICTPTMVVVLELWLQSDYSIHRKAWLCIQWSYRLTVQRMYNRLICVPRTYIMLFKHSPQANIAHNLDCHPNS